MASALNLIMMAMTLATIPTSSQNRVQVIQEEDDSPETMGRGIWGSWGNWEFCTIGTYARAAQLKFEKGQGSRDDTALNGVRLFCGDPADPSTKVITSSVGLRGEWLPMSMICPHELYAVELKYEQAALFQDDTAGTNLRFSCLSKYPHESSTGKVETVVLEQPGLDWAWGRWLEHEQCKSGQAICGLRTQVEEDQGANGDDTGFNGIQVKCCRLIPPMNK